MERLLAAIGLRDGIGVNVQLITALFCAFLLSTPLIWRQASKKIDQDVSQEQHDPYQDLQPIPDFDWTKVEPLRIWPFKPRYHLTMALEQITFNDLFAVDKTYLSRIQWRRHTMDTNLSETVLALPGSEPLINELYTYLFATYLPRRYPSMYILIAPPPSPDADPKTTLPLYLRNRVTAESIPISPPSDPIKALYTISAHIDTDVLLLSPLLSTSPDEEQKYHLVAFAACTPSGFSPREKLGKVLADIHAPVPGYAAKLEKSMDRYFASLPKGKIVKRANWSVTTDDELFNLRGNHFKEGEGGEEEVERQRAEVEVEKCRVRVERQTLHRLEETAGLCFAFKTYLYPLEEVRREGAGEALADAIEGLGKGSVPAMRVYKRGIVWGEKAVEYLRGGTGP
ncbi:hypothetical protein K461DRAFT_293577 [Myriangium duriaei CBS 260.36]|uniref:Uncharacterized protein n=1 Tax=Myriangium duriaei CBS 260.36 TaxID=1168546 RepID=A0A9P4J3A3_9PEZI|nr:hypothetical protein K461DRAFT_293577 [Myriangium duriaei CBS 260.36]